MFRLRVFNGVESMKQFGCNLAEREKLDATCRDIVTSEIDSIVPEKFTIAKIRALVERGVKRGALAGAIQGVVFALRMPSDDQEACRASEGIEVYSPSRESLLRQLSSQ